MKIRCGHYIHRLRPWFFMLCLSLLVVCLGKLASMTVRVRHGDEIEPHGVNISRADGKSINCTAIYEMDPVEVGRALQRKREPPADASDVVEALLTCDCQTFVKDRGYRRVPVSELEWSFPLAYTLVVHKNAPMVERILRAIYAPQNVYCLHYDQKSSPAFIAAMTKLAACVPHVFIASKLESVEYAHISRLKADLNCLSDLLQSPVRWRYVINLCGQDFPLKSNYELVKELRRLNGSNMLESSRPSPLKEQRFSFRYQLRTVPYEYHRIPVKTALAKDPPPHGIQMFIGSAYFVLSREFVVYVGGSRLVKDFLSWSEDTYSPDEHFWATLVRVPGVPGHIPRQDPDISDLRSKTRLVKWNYLEGVLYPACTGMHMRSVCIYGAAELRWLLNYGHWFANKFDPKVDPVLIECLEEKLMEKRWKAKT